MSYFEALPKKRNKWPFLKMSLGEVVFYSFAKDEKLARKAQAIALSYSSCNIKKFRTGTVIKDGEQFMAIERIE